MRFIIVRVKEDYGEKIRKVIQLKRKAILHSKRKGLLDWEDS